MVINMKFPKLQIMIDHLVSIRDTSHPMYGFDMSVYFQSDYQSFCIGALASILKYGKVIVDGSIVGCLRDLCEIDHMTAVKICFPESVITGPRDEIPIEQAILVLEHCRDTGIVNWSIGFNLRRRSSVGIVV